MEVDFEEGVEGSDSGGDSGEDVSVDLTMKGCQRTKSAKEEVSRK